MIAKSQGRSDSDGWQHWIQEYPLSYHITKEGAEARVKKLIDDEFANFNDWLIDYPHYREQGRMKEKLANIARNIIFLPIGDGGRDNEERELFVITPLDVED